MQTLIDSNPGELAIFMMDIPPDLPPQYAQIVVAQSSQSKQQSRERTIGICKPIENNVESKINATLPAIAVTNYFAKVERIKLDAGASRTGKLTLLQAPKHGKLDLDLGQDPTYGPYFSYEPNDRSYEGPDRATLLVEVGGYKVKVEYFFPVMSDVPGSTDEGEATDIKSICPRGAMWKISTINDADGKLVVTGVEAQSPPTEPLPADNVSSLLGSLGADASGVTLNIADLAGGALGQSSATTITLDDNAAGHGWFIDATLGENSEFLPTSNPNVWVAKEGSAAAGKMDMLSVLLHKYGHALGIEHSIDSRDYMATTLTSAPRVAGGDRFAPLSKGAPERSVAGD